MKENIILIKSKSFAIHIIDLYKYLISNQKEFVLSKQILRSGTAIGALIKESEHAQSKADFLNKTNIALKEANETEYWLELLFETKFIEEVQFNLLKQEIIEIIKILASIVKTAKTQLGK